VDDRRVSIDVRMLKRCYWVILSFQVETAMITYTYWHHRVYHLQRGPNSDAYVDLATVL
jgi:hypothetical protein